MSTLRTFTGLLIFALGCGASSERREAVAHVEAGALAEALAVYERRSDHEVLVGIAEAVLERDARSSDASTRRAAFSEMSVAGNGARTLLSRLAHEDASPRITRALALRGLLQLGETSARDDLTRLVGDADPEVVDAAVGALDAELDRAPLLSALTSPRSARRAAALSVLAKSVDGALLPVLSDAARHDPDATQRTAAVYALGNFQTRAVDVLTGALADVDPGVRLAAISVLVNVRREQAVPAVSRYLDEKPSVEAVEAAAALLRARVTSEEGRARQVLARALEAVDATLRARAALVIETLPPHELTYGALSARLPLERVPEVRLAVAMALGPLKPDARAALVSLADTDGVVAVQAAAALAAEGDAHALERLRAQLESPNPLVRVSLARTLGSELSRPLEVRSLMADKDAAVQRAAAGAVLRSLD